jgi:hypothetical protein
MIGSAPCEKSSTAVFACLPTFVSQLRVRFSAVRDAYDWQRSLWRESDLSFAPVGQF